MFAQLTLPTSVKGAWKNGGESPNHRRLFFTLGDVRFVVRKNLEWFSSRIVGLVARKAVDDDAERQTHVSSMLHWFGDGLLGRVEDGHMEPVTRLCRPSCCYGASTN